MKLTWENYLGSSPSLYAQKILKECGLKEPPICEKTVADYLGLEVKEVPQEDINRFEGIARILKTVCAWLQRKPNGKGCIWIDGGTMRERKRLGVFHECGHDVLPWHEGHDYLCSEKDIDPDVHKRMEREAFSCGSEFLMPKQTFVDDAQSLEIGILAIEQLGLRYVSSMEATAIWYARTHPGLCGVVMVESSENQKPKDTERRIIEPGQLILPMRVPLRQINPMDTKKYPIKVKYSVKSYRFPKYIRPGQGIEEGNRVFEAWASKKQVQGEVPAAVFGSSARWSYNAECIPLGNTGRMLVLLWLPCHQIKLNFQNGVIL